MNIAALAALAALQHNPAPSRHVPTAHRRPTEKGGSRLPMRSAAFQNTVRRGTINSKQQKRNFALGDPLPQSSMCQMNKKGLLMKSSCLRAALACIALTAVAPAAHAAHTLTLSPPAADGSLSGVFQNLAIGGGSFTDSYSFNLGDPGIFNATISSIFQAALNNNVDFTSVTINGQEFTVGSTGNVEFRYLNGLNVAAGPQTLVVSGTSGGNGSYAGTLSFARLLGGVPEPAAWTTLIAGFALVGSSMRRKRSSKLQIVSA